MIKDIDFNHCCLTIRMAKGNKDRVVTLASSITSSLKDQFNTALSLHEKNLSRGLGYAPAPYALRLKQLGHADVKTTEIYTHVIKRGAGGVISPLDKLE